MTTRLKDPPLVEIVCGYFFRPIALDPILVGRYWAERKASQGYDDHEVHPIVAERPGLLFGVPARSWLLKESGEYVLQLQADRMYFNWRDRGRGYPHFNDHGDRPGVLSQSLDELTDLQAFCSASKLESPQPERAELTKVDLFVSPKHWKDRQDLLTVMPFLGHLPKSLEDASLNVTQTGQRSDFQVTFSVTSALGPDMAPALRVETRISGNATKDVRTLMSDMNVTANEIFFDVLNENELTRFGGTE